jgi:hypothetical protein
MPEPLDRLREVAALNRRRTGEGITPLEYWLDLSAKLRSDFPNHPPLADGATRASRWSSATPPF